MSISIGIGWSKNTDSLTVGQDAAEIAKRTLNNENIDLAIVFSSPGFDFSKVLEGIKNVIKSDNIIGCSGTSIITEEQIEKKAVGVVCISSDELKFGLGASAHIEPDKEMDSGRNLAREALRTFKGGQRNLFMLFSDGLLADTSSLIRGIQEVLGKSFPIVGAASSDDLKFSNTFQFLGDQVFKNGAVGMLWTGAIKFGIGIKHGWKPLGRPRQVTSAYRNIIREIENKPAVSIYEDYFGKKTQDLRYPMLARMSILYPLGMYLAAEKEYLLRNVLGAQENGSLICQGDIPQGAEVRLMIGSKESVLESARQAAEEAKSALKGMPIKLALIFDSASRNKLLGRTAYSEIEIIKEVLGQNTPLMGFYTYGEDAPLKAVDYRGETYFHNETVNIFLLGG